MDETSAELLLAPWSRKIAPGQNHHRSKHGAKSATDLTGKRFGALTVIERAQSDSFGHAMWHCQCDCRPDVVVRCMGSNLVRGNTTTCGHGRAEKRRANVEIRTSVGKKFGRLTIVRTVGKGGGVWCSCECNPGQLVQQLFWSLKSGNVVSCGCLAPARAAAARALKKPPRSPRDATIDHQYGHHKTCARLRSCDPLPFDTWLALATQACHYCGRTDLRMNANERWRKSPDIESATVAINGIDRKDNTDYRPDNCLPCCKACNAAKGARSYEEYVAWILASARHLHGHADG